jgi:hypothetical protein
VNYDDETLMAYADGELDEARRGEIAQAIEHDPELARRVEKHRALRAEVAGAFSGVLNRPVPERLVRAAQHDSGGPEIEPVTRRGKVVQFPGRAARAPAAGWGLREWGAMAASVALGALVSWKTFAPSQSEMIMVRNGGFVAGGALASALDTQLASTQKGTEPVLIGLSFRMQDGQYCRSFALSAAATAGLACRVGDEWHVPVTAVAPGDADGMRQASSPPPAVMQVIQARISGEALDAAGEENARKAGWDAGFGQR